MSESTFTVEVSKTELDNISLKVSYGDEPNERREQTACIFSERFSKLASSWTSTAIAFMDVVPFLSNVGYFYADHDMEERNIGLIKSIASETIVVEENGLSTERYIVPMRESPRLSKSLAKTSQLVKTATVLRRSAFTALLAEYEAFVAELLTIVADIRPEVFLDTESTIPLKDVDDYETIEELKREQVKQRLENVLHGSSHKDVLDWIAKKLGINLTSDEKLIADFVEICQRRHLVSHAGSRTNRRYRRICLEAGCASESMLELDDTVWIDRNYLRRSTARVFQIGFFTLHLLWQKLLDNPEASDRSVLSCSHDFLENDLTKMARRLTKFSLARKKNLPNNRLGAYLVINEAQSYKFDPDLSVEDKSKLMEEALAQHDWSEKSPLVDLILSCLRDEFDGISEKVALAARVGDHTLTYTDIYVYNVFKEARENSDFMNGVSDAFGTAEKNQASGLKTLPSEPNL